MRPRSCFGVTVFVLGLTTASLASPREERKHDESPEPTWLRQIGSDFVNVFTSEENLLTLGLGAGATFAVHPADDNIAGSGFSELNGESSLDGTFEAGQVVGGAAVQMGSAFAAYGIGKLTNHSHLEHLGRDLVRAQIVTQTLTFGLKTAVGRERPDGSNNRSFPSGHASGTFATATVLTRHYGFRVGLPAYAVAGWVAGSRLNEGKHYLSDVVFGATLGILVGRTVTMELGKQKFVIEPMFAFGGAGAQMRWVPGD